MSSERRLFCAVALIVVALSSASTQTIPGEFSCYTVASLQGAYSIVVNYGANLALGLQPQTLDGKGNLTRTGILNQPTLGSFTGERTIGTVSSKETYTVNCNGSGVITRVVTKPDGTTVPEVDDFLITEAIKLPFAPPIATTIVDAQRVPSAIIPGGIFVTHVHTRLPDLNSDRNWLFPGR